MCLLKVRSTYLKQIHITGKWVEHFAIKILLSNMTNQDWSGNIFLLAFHTNIPKHVTFICHELHGINLFHSFTIPLIYQYRRHVILAIFVDINAHAD